MATSSPVREKDYRQPFPHTASPHRPPAVPSASSSTSSLSGSANPTVLTLDSILALHNSASDPKLAALDQAVSERNVLSAQNSQLWKLIEKQRSGYNQILKELERIRNERDSYKARLAAATGSPPEKRVASRERTPKQSIDSFTSDISVQNPRQNMTRFHSDEQVTPRTTSHSLNPTRSHERLNSSASSSSSRLTPLTVPPRPDVLPELSATQETPPQSLNAATPKYSHFAHGYGDTPSSSTRTYPRKSSFTESIASVSTSSAETSTRSAYSGISTPQTAPAEYSSSSVYTPVEPSLTSVLVDRHPHASATPSKQNSTLSTLSPAMAIPLSRDSRISLPDEARQYIANMADSPAPSPRMNMFNKTPSSLSHSLAPVSPSGDKEFLDMEEEGDEEEEDDGQDYEVVNPSIDPGESSQDTPEQQGSSVTPLTQSAHSSSNQPEVATTREFPLPSSTMFPQHAEARAEAAYQRQLTSEDPIHNDIRLDTQNLSPSNPAPSPAGFFRALPLLPTDLPHTRITVSHSFVRPNDRGKEVLSFIVHISPGKGKEGWKVEKMYSDVLNLDQRVRSSVGKSIGKKIATLPEGKLWKDHAPAKADQRKVRSMSVHPLL
jgi:RalA-binding protein 1